MIVATRDGGAMPAYLRLPPAGHGPVVVVLHETMGLNEHIRDVCGRFANEGFVAVAPDLFWRIGPGIELGYTDADIERAFDLYQTLHFDLALADTVDTLAQARAQAWCAGGVGTVGFCLGGRFAFEASTTGLTDCAVGYYGVGIDRLAAAAAVACPLMLHFGAEDKQAPAAAVDRIEARLASAGAQVHRYPGADHGFNCDEQATFHGPATRLAWARTVGFLRGHLDASAR